MNRRKAISQLWRERGITVKFTAAFGALLALIVMIAIVGTVALTVVRRETETAIVTSTEIQRLVLEMDGGLQEARHLEKDFFLRYPTLGYSAAYQTYAQPADEQIAQVRALSAELQQLISESDVSDAWRESDVNLNLYLSAASRHAATVEEAAELVARLAADEIGLQVQLAQNSSLLQDTLQLADGPGLMVLYREMQSFEKDYLMVRQRPLMQSAFNTAVPLREAIELAPMLEAEQKTQALTYLDNYLAIAEEILELDVAIRSKFNEFDLQAEAVDPISEELIALANQEVGRARAQIGQTNQSVTVILVATALAGLALAGIIARILNNSITRNVVKLTQVAGELQAGNLELRARIDSADELGQLADSFNAMATRVSSLVGSLEQKVAERTAALTTANEQLQQEIADRVRVEEALRESEERFRIALKNTPITVFNQDRDLRFTWAYNLGLDFSLEEVLGKTDVDLTPPEEAAKVMAIKRQVLETGVAAREEVSFSISGQTSFHDLTVEPLRDRDGQIAGITCAVIDITERKRTEEALRESEERYRGLYESSKDGIVSADMDGNFLECNQAFADMLGYTKEEVYKLTFRDITPSKWHDIDAKLYTEQMISRGYSDEYEKEYIRKDGTIFPVSLRGWFFKDKEGTRTGTWAIVREITERKQAEEERERLLAELEAKNRELESFVYTVSHDLKAPLVSLGGFSSVLQKEFHDQLGEQGQHYLERIQANVAHMDALIMDLLELSRIGRVVGAIEEVVVAALLREIQEEMALELEEVGAEFVVQEPLPAVRADRSRIRQVFANLIDNAVKFRSEERPLRIEVGCQEERGLYRFHVADNGIGIAPQYQEQIFAPFRQLDAKTAGVGMGLALVKKIVEHHGGRVWVESESGKGSTFYFTLGMGNAEFGMRNDSTIRIPNSTFEGGER